MEQKTKMIITKPSGEETEVEVLTSFFNKDETKQYVMYTKNEKQGDNTIVYTSIVIKESDKLILEEITDDNEWLEVKNIIRNILAE